MGFKIFRAWHMSKEETIEYSQSPFTFFILYNNELYVGIFSVSVVFKCAVETESAAFEISDVVGTMKKRVVEKNNETYTNYTYYVPPI